MTGPADITDYQTAPPHAAAIIVAAGRGLRAGGGLPKQYRDLAGRSVLARTVAAFDAHAAIGEIVVVRGAGDAALFAAAGVTATCPLTDVAGGASRDASVRAGLAALSGRYPLVLIHDAARPLVPRAVIDGVLEALKTHDGAAPALAVTDALWRGEATVKRHRGSRRALAGANAAGLPPRGDPRRPCRCHRTRSR
jgi:2-C-methyl-D-erythritol 4-phosphate cytidylyltransferase/2-C-methyl-D-erythritol 2,4-cyclodiphosphate synthase